MVYDLSITGKRIAKLREERNISIKELAKQIKMDLSVLSDIENGIRPISCENLEKMCNFFEVTPDYIISGDFYSKEKNNIALMTHRQYNEFFKLIGLV